MVFKRVVRTLWDPKSPEVVKYSPDWSLTDRRSPFVTPSLLVAQYLAKNPVANNPDEEVIDITPYDDITEFGADIQALGGIDNIMASRRSVLAGETGEKKGDEGSLSSLQPKLKAREDAPFPL